MTFSATKGDRDQIRKEGSFVNQKTLISTVFTWWCPFRPNLNLAISFISVQSPLRLAARIYWGEKKSHKIRKTCGNTKFIKKWLIFFQYLPGGWGQKILLSNLLSTEYRIHFLTAHSTPMDYKVILYSLQVSLGIKVHIFSMLKWMSWKHYYFS